MKTAVCSVFLGLLLQAPEAYFAAPVSAAALGLSATTGAFAASVVSALPSAPAAPVASALPSAPAAPAASAAQQEETVYLLGKLLRCPVCQGMPVGESPSPMARDMMQLIREKVAAGESHDAIKAYFVQRYGEWVLLAPQAQGFNWLVYLLPPLALGLCGLWTVSYLGRPRRPLAAEGGTGAEPPAGDAAGTQAVPDPYLEQIKRELRQ
jgi:cytochrome c-type biogenesis protein CcmH